MWKWIAGATIVFEEFDPRYALYVTRKASANCTEGRNVDGLLRLYREYHDQRARRNGAPRWHE